MIVSVKTQVIQSIEHPDSEDMVAHPLLTVYLAQPDSLLQI